MNFRRHDLWSLSFDLFRFHTLNCPNANQIILFDMVVHSSVEPCKQSIRSMKFTSQMHSFSSIFLHFNFDPTPKNESMNVINSTLTVIVTASIFIYFHFHLCSHCAPRHNSQFTNTQFYCYLCENLNESKYPTDFNNRKKIITIYRNLFGVNKIIECRSV